MLDFDPARRVRVIVCVQSQECGGLEIRLSISGFPPIGTGKHTSGTLGTANFGTPRANAPNPACEPHIVSEPSSSSNMSLALCISASALVVENLLANVFMSRGLEGRVYVVKNK